MSCIVRPRQGEDADRAERSRRRLDRRQAQAAEAREVAPLGGKDEMVI